MPRLTQRVARVHGRRHRDQREHRQEETAQPVDAERRRKAAAERRAERVAPNNTAAPAAPTAAIPAAWSVNAIRHQRLPNDSSTPDPTATTPVAPTISATLTP